MAREVLAVEVTGDEIRGAVMRGSRRRLQIVDFAQLKKEDDNDDLPSVEAIRTLAERLRFAAGRAVFVSPMARAFELRMDRVKVVAMKRRQLLEAVRWEAEPYTGIAGTNALISMRYDPKRKGNDSDVGYDDDQAPITVSAIERNVYRAVRERFRQAGFKLARAYPPDVTFYMPLMMEKSDVPRAILEVGQDYSNFAIVRGRNPEQISTMAFSLESLAVHLSEDGYSQGLEDSLRFMARQVPGPDPLIISGSGAADDAVVAYIGGLCPHGARPLYLSRSAGISDTGDEAEYAAFGTVAGAAIRELLGGRERELGVNDELSPGERLKKSAYLFPVAVTGITLTLLFGHYGYMRHKETVHKHRIEELNREVKERKAKMEEQERLHKELTQVNASITLAGRKIAFAGGQADNDLRALSAILKDFARITPDKVILVSFSRDDTGKLSLTGAAVGQGVIGRFISGIQRLDWCESAVLVKVERVGTTDGFLSFEIALTGKTGSGAAR